MPGSAEKIEIVIKYEDGSIQNQPSTPNVLKEETKPKEVEDDKQNILKSVVVNQGVQTAINLVSQAVSNTFSRYVNMKENYMLENDVKFAAQVLGKATSIGSMIIGGSKFGGGVGAIVMGAVGVASTYLQTQMNFSKHFLSLNASNMNVDFARTRAGLIDNGRGTEN